MNGRGRDDDRYMDRDIKAPRPAKEFATPRRARAGQQRAAGTGRARRRHGRRQHLPHHFRGAAGRCRRRGFWAWQEGFIDLDAMFGKGNAVVATRDRHSRSSRPNATRPGQHRHRRRRGAAFDRAQGRPAAARRADAGHRRDTASAPLALQSPAGDGKTEERLGAIGVAAHGAEATMAGNRPGQRRRQPVAAARGVGRRHAPAPCRSRARSNGARASTRSGLPTLVGKASIPARNLRSRC